MPFRRMMLIGISAPSRDRAVTRSTSMSSKLTGLVTFRFIATSRPSGVRRRNARGVR